MKCWHCLHYYIIMWEILWQPVKHEVTSHYGMYFGTESACILNIQSKYIHSRCSCHHVYVRVNVWPCVCIQTWARESIVFICSDYIRICVLIFVKVSLSLSLSLPIQFFSFFHSISLQSLRHQTFCYKTCLTVEIILTVCPYNCFVVTFSISLLWCTYTANNIHTCKHTLAYYTGTCINS